MTLSTDNLLTFQDLDQDDKKPWHVARKAKDFFLTLVCILIVVMLLFLPEENSNVNLITVQKSEVSIGLAFINVQPWSSCFFQGIYH